MDQEKCPCCPNHCDKNNLSCGRGRDYFGDSSEHPESHHGANTMEEQVLSDLRKCGHMLHHNKDINASNVLADLDEKELHQLHELLEKICHSK